MNFYMNSGILTKCMLSGFRRDADEICALLGYYAAYNGSSAPTFRDNLSVWFKETFQRRLAPAKLDFGNNEHYRLSVFDGLVCQNVAHIKLCLCTKELALRWGSSSTRTSSVLSERGVVVIDKHYSSDCSYRNLRSWTQTLTPPLFDWVFCPMDIY